MFIRIPQWSQKTNLSVNGKKVEVSPESGSYLEVKRRWKKGDVIELNLDMQPMLMEANPLVEEARNQIAVKRGPIVYCLESADLPEYQSIDNIFIPVDIKLTPRKITIDNSTIVCLEGEAELISENKSWENQLYRPVENQKQKVNIRLLPYYAWGNRGKGEMTVWMPLSR